MKINITEDTCRDDNGTINVTIYDGDATSLCSSIINCPHIGYTSIPCGICPAYLPRKKVTHKEIVAFWEQATIDDMAIFIFKLNNSKETKYKN